MDEKISSMSYSIGYQAGLKSYELGTTRINPYQRNTVEWIGWEDGYGDGELNNYMNGDQE